MPGVEFSFGKTLRQGRSIPFAGAKGIRNRNGDRAGQPPFRPFSRVADHPLRVQPRRIRARVAWNLVLASIFHIPARHAAQFRRSQPSPTEPKSQPELPLVLGRG